MQKIIATLLSFILAFLGLAPAGQPANAYTQAEWYAKVAEAYNLEDVNDDDYSKIKADDPNYAVVQACYDWNVLRGDFDADAATTNVFVAATLAGAANLAKANDDAAVKAAIDNGIIEIRTSIFGKYKEAYIDKADADAALAKSLEIRDKALRDVDNGGIIANSEGQIGNLSVLDPADINAEDIAYISYEGSAKPFATNAAGEFEDQSLLDKLNISFSVAGLKVKAKAQDTGFDVSLSGDIKGVGISKKYEVRNFGVTTKFDGDIAKKQINEAYVLLDYDLADITTISGSYAASLAEKAADEIEEGDDDKDFFDKIKSGMYEFSSGEQKITVFTYDFVLPNCPAITIGITAQVLITVEGYVKLVITSSETKGIEIINNKVRTISTSVPGDTTLEAQARIEAKLGIFADVKCVSICLIDVELQGGIGVVVTATMTGGAANYTLKIPVDWLFDVNVTYPNFENISIVGRVKAYGIVNIGVGNNSILSKIGLKKTWSLVNESNGTFLDKTFDIVKAA